MTPLKFNRLSLNDPKISKTHSLKSPKKIKDMLETSDLSKIEQALRKGFIIFEDKMSENKLLNKLK